MGDAGGDLTGGNVSTTASEPPPAACASSTTPSNVWLSSPGMKFPRRLRTSASTGASFC
jgi:hypothetical protein